MRRLCEHRSYVHQFLRDLRHRELIADWACNNRRDSWLHRVIFKYLLPVELVKPWFENAQARRRNEDPASLNCYTADKFFFDIDADGKTLRERGQLHPQNNCRGQIKGSTWGMLSAAAHGDRTLDSRGTDLHFALTFNEATRLFKKQMGSSLNDCKSSHRRVH